MREEKKGGWGRETGGEAKTSRSISRFWDRVSRLIRLAASSGTGSKICEFNLGTAEVNADGIIPRTCAGPSEG